VSGNVGRVETVIVGARGSRLAQTMVQELITHLSGCPVVRFKARSVMTDGDKDRKTLVRNLGGGAGGVFTTQLEQELLAGKVDIAVHSLKDLPTAPPDGLVLAVTPPRTAGANLAASGRRRAAGPDGEVRRDRPAQTRAGPPAAGGGARAAGDRPPVPRDQGTGLRRQPFRRPRGRAARDRVVRQRPGAGPRRRHRRPDHALELRTRRGAR